MMTKDDDGKLLGKRKRIPLRRPCERVSPVAAICHDAFGGAGSWTVIGDYIYWIGGWSRSDRPGSSMSMSLCKALLKHNMYHSDPTFWEIESSSMNIPRRGPFLAALTGTNKNLQLCAVGGYDYCSDDDQYFDNYDEDAISERFKICGEIYYLDDNTWTCLPGDFNLFTSYSALNQISLVEKDYEPALVVFYSLDNGSTVFLDLTSGTSDGPVPRPYFNLWQLDTSKPVPEGLNLSCSEVRMLQVVTSNKPAVFTDNTFYWFTLDMRLCGYHIEEQRWLQSQSVKDELALVHFDPNDLLFPLLVGLGDQKFLVIVADDAPGEFIIASLMVARVGDSLCVSVGSVQPLSLDEHTFYPYYGKAVLKDTRSGSMQG